MRSPQLHSISRVVITGLLVAGVAATSGCSWFRKGNDLYAQNPESRPLEVPPDLDLPRADAAMATPSSVTASGQAVPAPTPAAAASPPDAGASAGTGFTMPGSRDEVFNRVGEALGGIDGVEVASRAQLLGVFDVNYEGSNFLVRVTDAEAGARVSALDPRGQPATGDAPARLIAALQAAIGGN
ncbi:hypothetical protein [Lysobacter sp. D1-1-M9]|uniref:hypothetical protein n=1 Tax=Novilysobacter longmucuonensis TaxID=3098603 RepID=UPI002FCC979E